MLKWYADPKSDDSVVISSRIRLARNNSNYPFSPMLQEQDAEKMIREAVDSIEKTSCRFRYLELGKKGEPLSPFKRQELLEKHIVSAEFLNNSKKRALLMQEDCEVNIMLNEEDHIRIQALKAGDNLDDAWDTANKIDDLIEETIPYAFDKDFGYLTACPTNTGTGLRASFMMHLPLLEKTGQLKNILQALSKFGMTVRGMYGEGTESQGSIYQISNQITLGKSEQEIILSLKNVTAQIIEKEKWLWERVIASGSNDVEDQIYRSYGILANCRKISSAEAMKLLSQIRLGFVSGILKVERPKINLYHLMMNMQPSSLLAELERTGQVPENSEPLNDTQRDVFRAKYIQSML